MAELLFPAVGSNTEHPCLLIRLSAMSSDIDQMPDRLQQQTSRLLDATQHQETEILATGGTDMELVAPSIESSIILRLGPVFRKQGCTTPEHPSLWSEVIGTGLKETPASVLDLFGGRSKTVPVQFSFQIDDKHTEEHRLEDHTQLFDAAMGDAAALARGRCRIFDFAHGVQLDGTPNWTWSGDFPVLERLRLRLPSRKDQEPVLYLDLSSHPCLKTLDLRGEIRFAPVPSFDLGKLTSLRLGRAEPGAGFPTIQDWHFLFGCAPNVTEVSMYVVSGALSATPSSLPRRKLEKLEILRIDGEDSDSVVSALQLVATPSLHSLEIDCCAAINGQHFDSGFAQFMERSGAPVDRLAIAQLDEFSIIEILKKTPALKELEVYRCSFTIFFCAINVFDWDEESGGSNLAEHMSSIELKDCDHRPSQDLDIEDFFADCKEMLVSRNGTLKNFLWKSRFCDLTVLSHCEEATYCRAEYGTNIRFEFQK